MAAAGRLELPGFYFDEARNRYFRLPRGSGGGGGRNASGGVVSNSGGDGEAIGGREDDGGDAAAPPPGHDSAAAPPLPLLRLLQNREARGRSGNGFRRAVLETQASSPEVWWFERGQGAAGDVALVWARIACQSDEGAQLLPALVGCGTNGLLRQWFPCNEAGVWEQREVLRPSKWPPECSRGLDGVRRRLRSAATATDNKALRDESEGSAAAARAQEPLLNSGWDQYLAARPSSLRNASALGGDSDDGGNELLVTTLGEGEEPAALQLFRLEVRPPGVLHPSLEQRSLVSRRSVVATSRSSIWTCEVQPGGTRAASLGTSGGAQLVDLATKGTRALCASASAVLAQQFDLVGNVVLNGFRNGVISTIDLRLPPPRSQAGRPAGVKVRRLQRGSRGRHKTVVMSDRMYCSHTAIMRAPSAVCSLRALRSDDSYLVSSSMDGSLLLWDRRWSERPVLSYDGHVNSHSFLHLELDQTETLLASGGEDSVVRIWSATSGKLLRNVRGFPAPVSSVCSPSLPVASESSELGLELAGLNDFGRPWTFWLGSSAGLSYMCGSSAPLRSRT
eukprot:SM000091S24653  [mRNA]  locus=s91:433026:437631:- [translate_table: standard]